MSVDPNQLAQIQQQLQAQQQRLQLQQPTTQTLQAPQAPSFEGVLQLLFGQVLATIQNPNLNPSDRIKQVDSYTTAINKLLTGMATFQSSQNQQQGIPPEVQVQMEQAKMQHDQTLQTLQHHHQIQMDEQRLALEKQRLQHDMQLKQAETEQKLKQQQVDHVLKIEQTQLQQQQSQEAHQVDQTLKVDAHQHNKEMAEKAEAQKDTESKTEDKKETGK